MDQDIVLLRACKKRDRRGQEELFQRFSGVLYRVAFRYCGSTLDAEDIVIISFNKIFKHIDRFEYRGAGSLEGWLRKIVVNESLVYLRKNNNFNLTSEIDDTLESDLQPVSSLEAEDIYRLVAQLPIGYRTVFNLHVVEGFNHSEIAKQLGIQEGTSRSQLLKAKKMLRKMLNNEGLDYGT